MNDISTQARAPQPNPTPNGILIVEDEGLVAKDIARTLGRLGYGVASTVASGEEAIRLAAELKPDLILMDVRLRGEMDGIRAAEQIKAHQMVPVVFLTAFSDLETARRAVLTDPLGYLVKPLQEEELRCAIEIALRRHRYEVSLQEREQMLLSMSIIDELTQIHNRRGFFALAEQQLRVSRRNRQPFAVYFVDVDGLKQINDQFGHRVGDEAVKGAAAVLKQTFRDSDIVGRLGGDEFAVVAIGVTEDTTLRVLERLADNLLAFNQAGRDFTLEISVGAALYEGAAGDTIETMLARADAAMYRNKRERPQPMPAGA